MRARTAVLGALVIVTSLSACANGGGRPAASASPSRAGLPRGDSVRNGRFVEAVRLDGGLLLVDPAPASVTPSLTRADASSEIWASPVVGGARSGMVLGFGLVTTQRGGPNVPLLDAAPAWIGFAWGASYACPNQSAPASSHPELPSNGYAAVVLGRDGTDITYIARSSICGGPVTGPRIATATHVVSVAWRRVGLAPTGRLTVRYTLPACGRPFAIQASGERSSTTITVEALAPDEALPCPAPTLSTQTIDLAPPGSSGPPILRHGALGLVRQIQSV